MINDDYIDSRIETINVDNSEVLDFLEQLTELEKELIERYTLSRVGVDAELQRQCYKLGFEDGVKASKFMNNMGTTGE